MCSADLPGSFRDLVMFAYFQFRASPDAWAVCQIVPLTAVSGYVRCVDAGTNRHTGHQPRAFKPLIGGTSSTPSGPSHMEISCPSVRCIRAASVCNWMHGEGSKSWEARAGCTLPAEVVMRCKRSLAGRSRHAGGCQARPAIAGRSSSPT